MRAGMRRMRRIGLVSGAAALVLLSACEVAVTPMEPGLAAGDDLGGDPFDVIADPAGCALAVGDVADGYALSTGYWRSSDCTRFVGHAPPPPSGGGVPSDDRNYLKAVAAQPGGGFVAVGFVDHPGDTPVGEVRVTSSVDGVTWEHRTPPAKQGTFQWANDVLRTQAGTYLMVGADFPHAMAWRSHDLDSWEAVELPANGASSQYAAEVAQGVDGRLVAVGLTFPTPSESYAGAWVSSDDGRTWTAAPPPRDSFGSYTRMGAVTTRPDGTFLAAGHIGNRPALWSSPDGSAWTLLDTSAWPVHSSITNLAVDDGGVLALGSVTVEGVTKGVAWHLADGGTWTETRLAGVGSAAAAAPIGDGRFVVVGGNSHGKAWSVVLDY
jgi:hypothetical protein